MTRRRLPVTLAVVGALIILAVIIAASVVRSSDTATLTLGEERPDVPVVVTEPGVLDAVDPEVTVRATAEDDEPVLLAVGRTSEVEAWLGEADHARVTGLSSWEELTVEVVTGAPDVPADGQTPAPPQDAPPVEGDAPGPALPDPAGSDLWVVESAGTGTAELDWVDSPGRWSLVAATDGSGPAPELEIEWGRQVSTPWLVPGIVVGGVVLVAGVTMLVLGALSQREQRRRDEARARQETAGALGDSPPDVSITDTDPGTGERLTRRQIREMERAMARADRSRRAGEAGAPPIPLAPGVQDDGNRSAADAGADDAEPAADGDDVAADGLPAHGAGRAVQDADPAAGAARSEEGDDAATADDAAATSDATTADDPATSDDAATTSDAATAGAGSVEGAPADGSAATPASSDGPGTTGSGVAPTDTADEEEDDPAPAAPSWRSVWGFGGGAGRPSRTEEPEQPGTTDQQDATAERDQDDDGEERR